MSNKKNNRNLQLLNLLQVGTYTFPELMERCGVSRATLRRDLHALREGGVEGGETYAGLNIKVRQRRYCIEEPKKDISAASGQRWLTPAETEFVLSALQVLEEMDAHGAVRTERVLSSGMSRYAQSMKALVQTIVSKLGVETSEFAKRIVLKRGRYRAHPSAANFAALGGAVLEHLKVIISYTESGANVPEPRIVVPQRLVCYSGTWYVEAWNPERGMLRRYALDRIHSVELREPSTQMDPEAVERNFRMDYGSFHANHNDLEHTPVERWAKLRFSERYRQWARHEVWHAQQKSYADGAGWIIEVPYSAPEGGVDYELVGDIVRVGPDVEVLEPLELRQQIVNYISNTLKIYNK